VPSADDYGSITFTREFAEGILVVAEDSPGTGLADAHPGPDLDFLRSLVPYGRAGAELCNAVNADAGAALP
jgi:hypothetical protein